MWFFFFTKYSNSGWATAVSVLGMFMRYAGAMATFDGYVLPAGIILFAIGIGLHFWAEHISYDKFVSYVESQGYAARLRNFSDIDLAIDIYNDYPGKKTIKYIKTLNEPLGRQLEQMLINMVSNKYR